MSWLEILFLPRVSLSQGTLSFNSSGRAKTLMLLGLPFVEAGAEAGRFRPRSELSNTKIHAGLALEVIVIPLRLSYSNPKNKYMHLLLKFSVSGWNYHSIKLMPVCLWFMADLTTFTIF